MNRIYGHILYDDFRKFSAAKVLELRQYFPESRMPADTFMRVEYYEVNLFRRLWNKLTGGENLVREENLYVRIDDVDLGEPQRQYAEQNGFTIDGTAEDHIAWLQEYKDLEPPQEPL